MVRLLVLTGPEKQIFRGMLLLHMVNRFGPEFPGVSRPQIDYVASRLMESYSGFRFTAIIESQGVEKFNARIHAHLEEPGCPKREGNK